MEQLRLNARCDQLSSIYHVIIGGTSLDKRRIWFISRIIPCPECKVQAHCCKGPRVGREPNEASEDSICIAPCQCASQSWDQYTVSFQIPQTTLYLIFIALYVNLEEMDGEIYAWS
jgi:hypothetical protein